MVVCRFFLQGHCRFGDSCKFEHQLSSGEYSSGMQPQQNSNSIFTSKPSNPNVDTKTLLKSVANDMALIENCGQWLLTCYAPFKEKPPFPGFEDQSFEEVRLGYYESQRNNCVDQYKLQLQNALQDASIKFKSLKNPNPEIINLLVRIYNTPVGNNVNPSSAQNTSNFMSQPVKPNIFGQNNTQNNIFGQATASSTNQQSVFSNTLPKQSIFSNVPPNQSSIFATPATNQQSSIFATPATNQQSSIFATSPHNQQSSIFATSPSNQQSSVFATPVPNQQSSIFATSPQNQASIFAPANKPLSANPNTFGSDAQFNNMQQQTSGFNQNIFQNNAAPNQPTFNSNQQNIFQTQPTNFIGAQQNLVNSNSVFASTNTFTPNTSIVQPQQNQPLVPSQQNNPSLQPPPPAYNQNSTSIFRGTSMTPQSSQSGGASSVFATSGQSIIANPQQMQGNIFGGVTSQNINQEIYSKLEDLTEEEINWFKDDNNLDISKIPDKPPTYEMCFN